MRGLLIETARPVLAVLVEEITGVQAISVEKVMNELRKLAGGSGKPARDFR